MDKGKKSIKATIDNLYRTIRRHDFLYYSKEQPEISDADYDALIRELNTYKQQYPDLFADIEAEVVGFAPENKFNKIKHLHPMLSLGNAFSNEELEDFWDRVKSLLPSSFKMIFTCEFKVDGLSFSALYDKGKLQYVATRGDGYTGEEVTLNMLEISNFPRFIDDHSQIEIRGEVFLDKNDFLALNDACITHGEAPFANPRNAASGSLRQLDPTITRSRNLKYLVWDLRKEGIKLQSEAIEYAASLGFSVLGAELGDSIIAMEEFYNKVLENRANLNYDIDGVVYKLNDKAMQERLGFAGRSPRWATAYKFPAKSAITIMKGVKFQVGRTGVITPIAELEPVNIGGALVARASLYNEDELKEKDFRIGDYVNVERAGDVIPKVISVIVSKRTGKEQDISFPINCPVCETKLVRIAEEVAWRCPNKYCSAQHLERLKYFVSREGLDIEGFGSRVMEVFFEDELVRKFVDVFTLEKRDKEAGGLLAQREGWGEKSASNLFNAIELAKNVDFSRFLTALGIRYVGSGLAKLIARNIKDLSTLLALFENKELEEALLYIDGVGRKAVAAILEYLEDQTHYNELLELNDILDIKPIIVSHTGKLAGKKLVFTGDMESMSRKVAKLECERLGGVVQSSVSGNTDILVVGKNPGSKLKKAQELDINIIDEKEWLKMVGG